MTWYLRYYGDVIFRKFCHPERIANRPDATAELMMTVPKAQIVYVSALPLQEQIIYVECPATLNADHL